MPPLHSALETCQEDPSLFGRLLPLFPHYGLRTAVHVTYKSLQKVANERHLSSRPLLRMHGAYLHSILPGDGGAKLRVVQEGNVDADQWRPVSRQDLTSDYRHQAAWTNKQMRGPGKRTMPSGLWARHQHL